MDIQTFQVYVRENLPLLQGVLPETLEDLARYEEILGFPLPPSMKWLLSAYGYSMACGVENLEGSVQLTLDCRSNISLPLNILLINDWNDGGLVFLIADKSPQHEYPIYWTDTADIYKLIEGKPLPAGVSKFDSFSDWVEDRVAFETEQAKYEKNP